ncbi:MAG: putative cytoplasmic protein [Acidimicrobiaceae bacterium]|nr:putative cytoplasmic protein [Acidimicrobiaceae bacterium]
MSDASEVRPHLERRFASQQIVFWHDPDGQYAEDLDADLPGVETIRVADNEFAVRYRLLRGEPTGKFLVYRAGRVPDGTGNWLLDLELAYGVFTADRGSLIAQDLGLRAEGVDEVVRKHGKFFNAAQRVEALKALLNPGDDLDRLRAKMVAVVLGQRDHVLSEITRTLLVENAQGQHAKYDAIADYGLDDFHWRGVARIYGYESDSPSVDDLVLWIFRQAIDGFKSDRPGGLQNIQFDFANLRNDRRSEKALATLARRVASDLGYAATIEDTSFRDLVAADVFEEADRKIISDLARMVAEQAISAREVAEVVRERQNSFWYEGYQKLYKAISSAAELLGAIATVNLTVKSFDDGLERYRREWFRIDQLYRQFVFFVRTAEHQQPLEPLRKQVEKRYTNGFLYELGTVWQQRVDETGRWRSSTLSSQASFYARYVEPLVRDGDKKAVVVISDALRYEVAEELGSRIRQEDRYDASLDAVLGVLPSYTKLGMAAILPHSSLEHSPDAKAVLADGQPTDGTIDRGKVLQKASGAAIQAKNFRALGPDERRDLFKANRVLYVYHNRIDATGDKPDTEQQVFEAAEDALRELVALVKMLANANATNIFITADHGFLFQDEALPETFFLSTKPQGDDMKVINRRFVLGRGLKPDSAFTTFTSAQLGLQGDLEIQVPKSILRLRVAGGGSQFVHGGATLQEIVVPVLMVNKRRKSDIRPVNVEIWPESDKITTGQVAVRLFQAEPVSDKIQPRTLRGGLYVGDALISNTVSLTFDQATEDKRDRYQHARLLLSQDANAYNNHAVEFRLEEPIPNTTQWRTYAKVSYILKRSFTSDFDF